MAAKPKGLRVVTVTAVARREVEAARRQESPAVEVRREVAVAAILEVAVAAILEVATRPRRWRRRRRHLLSAGSGSISPRSG